MVVPVLAGVAAPAPATGSSDNAELADIQVSLLETASAPSGGALPSLAHASLPTPVTSRAPSLVRTIKLAQGSLYEVSLLVAGSSGVRAPPSVMVQAGSVKRQLVGHPGTDWSRVAFRFQAPRSGPAELHIVTASDDVLLDDVKFRVVNETGSLPLLIGGLLWMGLVLNRRRPAAIIPRLRTG